MARLSLLNFDKARVRGTALLAFVGLLTPLTLALVTGNPIVAQFPILQVYLSPILIVASIVGLRINKVEPARSTWCGILIGVCLAALVGIIAFFLMLNALGWLG
jgi:hypothetical protein